MWTDERVPLAELIERQGVTVRGFVSIIPEDVSEAEVDEFLAALEEL